MKKCLCFVVIATTILVLCANISGVYAYSNNSLYSTSNCDGIILDNLQNANFQTSCASSCSSVSAANDCGHAIYDENNFPGPSNNATMGGGNGSGLGCQTYGFSTPIVLNSQSGSSYTMCTEYTSMAYEASYYLHVNAGTPSCVDRSIAIYNANTCATASGVNITQPTTTFPGSATGLTPGNDYVLCHTYTSACSDDFASSLFEVCASIVEVPHCSSNPDPRSAAACADDNSQLELGSICTADPDFRDYFPNGVSGFAAFFYTANGTTLTNFPSGMTAGNIGGNSNIRFYDESNAANGGDCSPINLNPRINTSCTPLIIPVGIVGIDVNSIGTPILNIIPDCPIVESTITVHPKLTSQVSGNNIYLISAGGTICQTIPVGGSTGGGYTSGSSSSGINDDTDNTNQGTVTLPTTTGDINGYNPRPGFTPQTISGISVQGTDEITPPPPSGSSSSSTTVINVPCVTPSGNRVSNTGETLIGHTVEVSDEGKLVIVLDEPIPSQVKVYPNPASNQLFFNTSQADNYAVQIYDTFGKQVFYTETNDNSPLDISHLPSGLYTYALENESQTLRNHGKWVKQ